MAAVAGKHCQDFGTDGILDLAQWNTVNAKYPLSILQPTTVYKDTLFIGWAGKDWTYQVAPPGTIFAVNARTGKLKWQFDAIPKDQEARTGKLFTGPERLTTS